MWSSSIRRQVTLSSKLHSIDWTDSSTEGEGGWIATGTQDRSLSINWMISPTDHVSNSYSTGASTKGGSLYKSSFNLKGHVGEVRMVRWSPQGDRLATYDSWGYIKVFKNRANVLAFDVDYSIKMVVTDIQWSSCGCYLAVCGEEGYMQVLSGITGAQIFSLQVVTSPRYGSFAQFTTLSWNKSITSIALGTERGEVIDIDPLHQGRFISTMIVRENIPVQYISYYGPVKEIRTPDRTIHTQSLSLYLANGEVAIFHDLSTATCMCVHTCVINGRAQWNSLDTLLVVIGYHAYSHVHSTYLTGRFLDSEGLILLTIDQLISIEPRTDESLLHCISWGLFNSTVFIAYDKSLYNINILTTVPSLLKLCREYVAVTNMNHDYKQLLPQREIEQLQIMSSPLIMPLIDSTLSNLFSPLTSRLHCIITPDNNTSLNYTLQYEQMGSYITLLTAEKRVGKFFNIYYRIKPTITIISQEEEEAWAVKPNHLQLSAQPTGRRWRERSNRYQIAPVETDSTSVIATISGNTLTKHYKFMSSEISSTFQRELGFLNVTTHYIKCEPRDLLVALYNGAGRGEKFELSSKKPEWNPQFGIFELDFGGRINKDSVKNFQFEYNNEIVFQFGKSIYDRYCLDFQYPFSPVTAFCVALASLL